MKNIIKLIGLIFLTLSLSCNQVNNTVVVIDAGHGGKDAGASVNNISEKDITINIAKKIKELNKNANIKVILTRNNDTFISLEDRAKIINEAQPNLVLSLHTSFSNDSLQHGKNICINDTSNLAPSLFYLFDKNITIKKSEVYLLKNVKAPIALMELGYLSNEEDRKILTSEQGQTELAKSILKLLK